MKTLAIIYEELPEQVFINAASVAGITPEAAKRVYSVLLADSAPTIVNGLEPEPLALNSRAIETMLAVEGHGPDAGVNTRWLGVRYTQTSGPRKGGFISDKGRP
jgi:hypothetical protein